MERIEFGKYIVADPKICHGKLTFKGTRIFVQHVLEMVADGMDWTKICDEWDNVVSREAIAEAIRLAAVALAEKSANYEGGKSTERVEFGKYIVSDPRICHGIITFKGTRIFVQDVVEMVSDGMDWNQIIDEWRGSITKEAIAEAISIAGQFFIQYVANLRQEEAA